MNNKELIAAIAAKSELSKTETSDLLENVISILRKQLENGDSVSFHGFGTFEVKKRDERLSVHPATQKRTLIPPKLVVNFKQSSVLKTKMKGAENG